MTKSPLLPWDQSPDPRKILKEADPDVFAAIEKERERQQDHIELIASENYVSASVLAADGSALTNKYAEGLPGARYYGGCEYVDIVEQLAIDRAKSCSGRSMPTCSPTPAPPPTSPPTWPCCSRATRCWA